MEAIILAGGFGTRLRPLTYTRAKSLLPIMNKPMISHLIETLPKEVDKIVLAVNYRRNQIEDYFKKHDCGKKIIVNDEPTPLGTGGAVKFAEKHISDRFLVLNSDVICSLNLKEMINFHEKNNAVGTISLWPVENVSEFGVADVEENGNIVGFVEKPRKEDAPSEFINAGAYLLEPEVLNYIDKGRLISMEKEIFPQIIKDTHRFYGFKFSGYWMDIGRISSYLDVHKLLLDKDGLKNFVGEKNELNGVLEKTTVGNNVYIGKNSKIESSIILDGARIEEDVILSGCIIGKNGIVGKNSNLKYIVLGDNEKLEANSTFDNKIIWTQPKPEGYPDKQIGNPIENK